MGVLEEIIERLEVMPSAQRKRVTREARKATADMVWVPNPGFQTETYFSDADEVGCGGEAGPGKTDLAIGLALTKHYRSLILRRTNKEAGKLQPRMEEILGTREGWHGSPTNAWKVEGGTQFDLAGQRARIPHQIQVDIGGVQLESDKQKYKGDPHDLIVFDQLEDFTETQYTFIIGWNRSTNPNTRCRIVSTLNPPTRPLGLWVIRRFAPWLDPKHHNPAKSGELRWYTTIDGQDAEVEDIGPHLVEGKWVSAKSRTFIRGHLWENPDLAGTGYEGRLAGLPEDLRVAYLQGSFEASLRDAPNQTIPTSWVKLAQQRWDKKPAEHVPMCSIGVDCTGGGADPLLLARRYDGWYDEMLEVPGKEVPVERIGSYCAGIIVSYRRDRALIVIDMGGGYGGSTYEHCKSNDIDAYPYKGAESTDRRSADKKLRFTNVRSAAHWVFREALDPDQPGGSPIALPEDPELVADLTTPTFEVTPNGIRVESKEDVVARLGRSTNKGDAVIMAWWAGPKEITDALAWAEQREALASRRPMGRLPKAVMGGRAPLTGRGR